MHLFPVTTKTRFATQRNFKNVEDEFYLAKKHSELPTGDHPKKNEENDHALGDGMNC